LSTSGDLTGWHGAYAEFAPFVAYTRQFVDGKNPNKTANVDNIGLGIVGDFLLPGNAFQSALPFGKGIYNDIQLSAQEVHSDISATDIVSAKVTYSPFFDPTVLPGVGTTERAGDFLLLFSPQAVFISGDVLDNGNNPNLSKTGTYQRVGTHLAYSATADTGPLNGFQFIATYDYLKSYGGPVSNITLLTTTLSYAIPQTNFWSVKLQYQDGRNLDTLVQQKLITLGLGLKY